ncbi:GNAT family N-acetyltransferase [Glaciibacter superstes]|uniref:GNAT family N-acetyltransferase n=1 Tax=Glaciibacter superstes TaxID=501023 RepID=UPI0003B7525C|nr:GNAT family N-acetyltransferase [Glaciibacter superstes]
MSSLVLALPDDITDVTEFLRHVDLTLSGLDSPTVQIWIERDAAGEIVASTGFELSDDREHVLIRSVAVHHSAQRAGEGTTLALFALARAMEYGAQQAWLFSRRSGLFWQKLGFEPASRDELAHALASTHQVRLFVESGQLDREVAWTRSLRPR